MPKAHRDTSHKSNPGMEQDLRDLKFGLTHDKSHGIPPDLWHRARVAALIENVPVKVWIADAIRTKLGDKVQGLRF